MSQLDRAKNIKRNLGRKSAKGYMNKRGWSLAAKLYVLYLS